MCNEWMDTKKNLFVHRKCCSCAADKKGIIWFDTVMDSTPNTNNSFLGIRNNVIGICSRKERDGEHWTFSRTFLGYFTGIFFILLTAYLWWELLSCITSSSSSRFASAFNDPSKANVVVCSEAFENFWLFLYPTALSSHWVIKRITNYFYFIINELVVQLCNLFVRLQQD